MWTCQEKEREGEEAHGCVSTLRLIAALVVTAARLAAAAGVLLDVLADLGHELQRENGQGSVQARQEPVGAGRRTAQIFLWARDRYDLSMPSSVCSWSMAICAGRTSGRRKGLMMAVHECDGRDESRTKKGGKSTALPCGPFAVFPPSGPSFSPKVDRCRPILLISSQKRCDFLQKPPHGAAAPIGRKSKTSRFSPFPPRPPSGSYHRWARPRPRQ